jgi:hypothetical protein
LTSNKRYGNYDEDKEKNIGVYSVFDNVYSILFHFPNLADKIINKCFEF